MYKSLIIGMLAIAPMPLAAQLQYRNDIKIFDPVPTAGIDACSIDGGKFEDGAWASLLSARELSRDEAKEALAHLQDSVAAEAAEAPTDVEMQYLLAAVIGTRADIEGGRTKVRAANALYEQVHTVLELDPDHAGAQHLLGRLHAAVMRMDRFTRFVATKLLGGSALSGASWNEAQSRLEAAAAGDPCVPDHHFELARLYADRGEPLQAAERLEIVLALRQSEDSFATIFDKARHLLAQLDNDG